MTATGLLGRIKKDFRLDNIPRRIEAYDFAHASGGDVVTSKISWNKGKTEFNRDEVWHFGETDATQAIRETLLRRSDSAGDPPDLILIVGGKTQFKTVIKGLGEPGNRTRVFCAVKAPGKTGDIAYFLNERLETIKAEDPDVHRLTGRLLDAAHDLANRTHLLIRGVSQFYALAIALPNFSEPERRSILKETGSIKNLRTLSMKHLTAMFGPDKALKIQKDLKNAETREVRRRLVPIRFDAPDGDAENLRPIETINFAKKSKKP